MSLSYILSSFAWTVLKWLYSKASLVLVLRCNNSSEASVEWLKLHWKLSTQAIQNSNFFQPCMGIMNCPACCSLAILCPSFFWTYLSRTWSPEIDPRGMPCRFQKHFVWLCLPLWYLPLQIQWLQSLIFNSLRQLCSVWDPFSCTVIEKQLPRRKLGWS